MGPRAIFSNCDEDLKGHHTTKVFVQTTGAAMVTISEVKGNSRENRTSAHTHIKGLGLRNDGYADHTSAGFVGQVAAREVSWSGPTRYGQ